MPGRFWFESVRSRDVIFCVSGPARGPSITGVHAFELSSMEELSRCRPSPVGAAPEKPGQPGRTAEYRGDYRDRNCEAGAGGVGRFGVYRRTAVQRLADRCLVSDSQSPPAVRRGDIDAMLRLPHPARRVYALAGE